MKKIILIGMSIFICILACACGKNDESSVIKNLSKKITKTNSYHAKGELEIINNEDSYLYDVDVSYEKDDKFRVSLKNQTNNHEQIILKNEEGVYVLTPSLNKSFKFQSEWPYNNSQAYLLQTILKDIESDKDRTFKKVDDGYIITSKVNYSNNKELVKQNVYIDKDYNITNVDILDEKDNAQIKMTFNDIDMKATFDDNYFTLKENMTAASTTEDTKTVDSIDDIIYPMYMPNNTNLTSQEKVDLEHGERIILTFDGDKPFMLIEETTVKEENPLTIPVSGEPVMFADTVAALTDNSINWYSNGIEYYVVSTALTEEELLDVAKSISVLPVGK